MQSEIEIKGVLEDVVTGKGEVSLKISVSVESDTVAIFCEETESTIYIAKGALLDAIKALS